MSKLGGILGGVAAGAAATLVIVMVLVLRDDRRAVLPREQGPDTAVEVARSTSADRPTGAQGGAPVHAPAGPLPPVGTPFRLAIDELQQRARAGEPAAMCRLAAEHTECKRLRGMLDATSEMLEMQDAGVLTMEFDTEQQRARHLARMTRNSEQLIEESRHCDGVPEIGARELVHQWRAAALAGSLPAMEHYALGRAFPMDQWLSLLPELATYRSEAEPLARRLAEKGSRRAIQMLATAYMPDRGARGFAPLLHQAVEPDAVQALALLRVSMARPDAPGPDHHFGRLRAAQIDRLEARLTPEQHGAVAQRIAELKAGWRGRPAPYEEPAGREALVEACAAP